MNKTYFFVLLVSLINIDRVNIIESQQQNAIEKILALNIPTSISSKNDEINVVEENKSVTMTELGALEQYAFQPKDLKIQYNLCPNNYNFALDRLSFRMIIATSTNPYLKPVRIKQDVQSIQFNKTFIDNQSSLMMDFLNILRETVFDIVQKECCGTKKILQDVRRFLDTISFNPILEVGAQAVVQNRNFRKSIERNMRQLQTLSGNLQNEFDLKFKYSRIRAGSQFKFQFNEFGEGFPHQIENMKIIERNNQRYYETLPGWLYFDEWNRQFRGKVPEEEVGLSYEITIKFSSETNQKTDKFLFTIYQNEGVCALELIGGLDTYGFAQSVTTIKIREKVYALLADGASGLKIIEVSDPQNPMLVSSLDTDGVAKELSTVEIGVKIYVMLADGPSGLKIIDVSDPYNPVLEGRIYTDEAIGVSTIKIEGKIYAMVADNEEGLQIIEVSDPKNPVLASSISGFQIDQDYNFIIFGDAYRVSTMQIEQKPYALVGAKDDYEGASLKIIEVSDPQNPVIVSSIFIEDFNEVVGVSMIQIREKIYALLLNLSGDLFIIEVSDPQNPKLRGTISLSSDYTSKGRGLSSIEIGVKIYALVVGDGGLNIIEVSNPENPVLVISIVTKDSAFGVSTIEIEGIIYALVADYKGGLQLIQIKLSNKQRNYFFPISVSNIHTPGYAYDLSMMQLGQKIYALVVNSNAGLLIIEVSDPQNPKVGYSFDSDGNAQGVSTIQIGVNMYGLLADGSSGLKIIKVSNPQDPLLVSSIDIAGTASGVCTMELGEQIYAFVSDADAGLKIIEISDPQNPKMVSSINTGRTQYVRTMQIGLNIYALVACYVGGLKIIKVSDLQNLVQVGSLPLDDIARSISIVEIGIKIYALVTIDDIGLEIIEVSDPENPESVGSIDTNGKSMGVSTIEMGRIIYALVADYNGGFKMIELSDPRNPVLVGSVQTNGLAWGVSTMQNGGNIYALVSKGQQFWETDQLQGLQIIKLTDNIALYPYINSNINQQIREFQVNLYPIYMDTFHAFLEENILISLSIIKREKKQLSPLPYWVSINLEEKIMNFIPASKEQLEKLRYIHYTFSTKLNRSDLVGISGQKTSEDVIVELIKIGYLDSNLFLTKFFNIEKDLILDSSFNKSGIKKVLSKYFHEGYFEMTIQDFLELNNRPKIEEGELQRQFDSQVGKTKVTKKIDFQFSDAVFVDPDGDLLTYTITRVQKRDAKGNLNSQIELPDWLTFDKATRRFQGTPGIEDLGEYTINVQAFDKYQEISQNFTIFLTNNVPIVQEEIPQQFTNLRLGSRFDYIFSERLFYDSDKDLLNFQAEIIYTPKGQNTDIKQLLIPTGSFWMYFDSQSRHLTGTPDSTDIQENSEGYDQNFTIKITATDIAEKYVSKEFNLRVTRLFPKLNNNLTIQYQFDQLLELKNIILKVGQKLDFVFSDQTFIHEDNLIYRLQKREETSFDSQSFGNWTDVTQINDYWLKFDGQNRRIYGTPQKQDIKKYQLKVFASDKYKEIETVFEISLTNNVPIVQEEIPQQFTNLRLGSRYDYQFSGSLFYDSDYDLLNFQVEIIYTPKGQNTDIKQLLIPTGSFWMYFDSQSRHLTGTPDSTDIQENSEGYDQNFTIKITATDIAEKYVSIQFNLRVTRLFPKLNNNLTIQYQFDQLLELKNIILKVGWKLDFVFSDQTFIHEDNLIYLLQKREETSSDSQSFGDWTDVTQINDYWLKFDGQNRRIYGTPQKQDIKKYQLKVFASDRYKEIEIIFAFKITNKSPIVIIPIKNQIKEAQIDETYEFQFDLNTFYDEDGDNLIYKAELADGKPLPKWLVFKPGDRKFEATPENFDVVKIRLIATDMSEESISDEFELNIKISIFYILRTILQYSALVLGILGVAKYRAYIYEIIFKNQYQYKRDEEAKVGEEYYKKISLIREDVAKGFKLWKNLKDNSMQGLKQQNKHFCRNIENDWFEQKFMKANIIDKEKLEEELNRSIAATKIQNFNKDFIDGIIANKLIKKNPSTIKIYEQLKRESSYFIKKNNKIYSPKDWYKEYIKNPQKNEEIQININKLEKKLSSLDKIDILNLDKKMLIDIILSNARGIDEISEFSPSQGENMHLDEQKIKMVKAKQKIKEIHGIHLLDRIKKKLKFFKLNLTDIKIIDNRKLPKWLQVDILENNLYLWGTPQKEDMGEIIIQLIGVNNFILREFTIDVSEKEEKNLNINKMIDVFNISLQSNQIENKNCEISSNNDEPIVNQIRDINSPRIPEQIYLPEIVRNFFQSSTKSIPEIEMNIQNKQQ